VRPAEVGELVRLDAMAQEPCGFQAATKGPLKPAGADPLLAGTHQIYRLEPHPQRHMAGFEHATHPNGKGLAAGVALPQTGAGGLAPKPACRPGYRVSTAKQGRSGLGLEAQKAAVLQYLNGGSWTLSDEFTEVESGKLSDRAQLALALKACRLIGATLVQAHTKGRKFSYCDRSPDAIVRASACDAGSRYGGCRFLRWLARSIG
jgi:Resolvase, N terminal domain